MDMYSYRLKQALQALLVRKYSEKQLVNGGLLLDLDVVSQFVRVYKKPLMPLVKEYMVVEDEDVDFAGNVYLRHDGFKDNKVYRELRKEYKEKAKEIQLLVKMAKVRRDEINMQKRMRTMSNTVCVMSRRLKEKGYRMYNLSRELEELRYEQQVG